MGIHNSDVADAFDEIADLLSIEGENPFRIRAYRRAARIVRSFPRELAEMRGASEFEAIPGIGADLAKKIVELIDTGRLKALDALRRRVPPQTRELLGLPGLGPVRVRALMSELKVENRQDLERAIAAGRLTTVHGFGAGIQSRLEAALARRGAPEGRLQLSVAAQYAKPLREYLASLSGVSRVEIAGSYRRGRDTVGDLDVLVCAARGAKVFESLRRYADLREISASGTTKASGVLRNGLQVDVRVVPRRSFGAALHYFTGSKDHNLHTRRLAQEKGWKLSEYGLFEGERQLAGATEEGVYRALGLTFIPPELREDRGEIEAAARNALPELIERADIKGDLHVHTDASDGTDSLERMVAAAQAQKLSYVAITDHAKHLGIVHGLDAERLARQADAIDALNERLRGFTIFKGVEVDILEDGKLALADAALERLDVVVVAVHDHFNLSASRQTRRILRALERPRASVLAHPSGRLIGEREPYACDFAKIFDAVRERGGCLEVNGQPSRLDLTDSLIKAALERGVRLSLASDAHSGDQLAHLEGAIRQARRGWATRRDALNTRPVSEVRSVLRQ